MVALVILLALVQEKNLSSSKQVDWFNVPASVVQEVRVRDGSWKAEEGIRKGGNSLRVEVRVVVEDDGLELLVSDDNGLSGDSIILNLSCSAEGTIRVGARSLWHTDVGSQNSGANDDLHGQVLVESRMPGDEKPLRIAFRLHSIESSPLGPSPRLSEGEIEVGVTNLGWIPLIRSPGVQESVGEAIPDQLQEVLLSWPDGTTRSRGSVDHDGRREGMWSTWYSNGAKESEATFAEGEREGRWLSFGKDGSPFEVGQLRAGLRDGEWTSKRKHRDLDQETTWRGHYIAGKKEGEWVEQWHDGTLKARGSFEAGLQSGRWTEWRPTGVRLCEGVYQAGWAVGDWVYWNDDGSVEKVERKMKPWPGK